MVINAQRKTDASASFPSDRHFSEEASIETHDLKISMGLGLLFLKI
jgi:hypothetical protein